MLMLICLSATITRSSRHSSLFRDETASSILHLTIIFHPPPTAIITPSHHLFSSLPPASLWPRRFHPVTRLSTSLAAPISSTPYQDLLFRGGASSLPPACRLLDLMCLLCRALAYRDRGPPGQLLPLCVLVYERQAQLWDNTNSAAGPRNKAARGGIIGDERRRLLLGTTAGSADAGGAAADDRTIINRTSRPAALLRPAPPTADGLITAPDTHVLSAKVDDDDSRPSKAPRLTGGRRRDVIKPAASRLKAIPHPQQQFGDDSNHHHHHNHHDGVDARAAGISCLPTASHWKDDPSRRRRRDEQRPALLIGHYPGAAVHHHYYPDTAERRRTLTDERRDTAAGNGGFGAAAAGSDRRSNGKDSGNFLHSSSSRMNSSSLNTSRSGQEASVRSLDELMMTSYEAAASAQRAADAATTPLMADQCRHQATCQCGAGRATLCLTGAHEGPPMRYCPKCRKKAVALAFAPYSASIRRCACGRSQPSFGLPGDEPPRVPKWCAQCPTKPPHAIDVVSKRCLCGRSKPSLGLRGEERRAARWCAQCPTKPADAVDIVNKRCECQASLPSLGLPGEERRFARWCAHCPSKPPNAVNVINKRCECRATRPRFGLPGDKPRDARWCLHCPGRPSSAVDVIKQKRSASKLTPEVMATTKA